MCRLVLVLTRHSTGTYRLGLELLDENTVEEGHEGLDGLEGSLGSLQTIVQQRRDTPRHRNEPFEVQRLEGRRTNGESARKTA